MKLVMTRRLPGDGLEELQSHFQVTVLEKGRPLSREELERAVSDCEVLICTLTDSIDAPLLEKAPQLRCVVSFSSGLDHIDRKALAQKRVRLVYTPGVLTDATADLAWALILGCARRLRAGSLYLEEGRFSGFDPGLFLGKALQGATLGILGMGRIGQAVAKRACVFGMQVIFTHSKEADPAWPGRPVDLAALLTRSDVLSLHASLNEQTRGVIGRKELALMKKDAVLVNTSRGGVVDEQALIAHLRSHPEFQAGLDVFAAEPFVPAELVSLPNALCLPHLGSATVQARLAMARTCVDEAVRFKLGEPLQSEAV